MQRSSSPSDGSTHSVHSTTFPIDTSKNRPPQNSYIKAHKNISFSFPENSTTFQHGALGDYDTFLIGNLHLNYSKGCYVKNVFLEFKGTEKTSWFKAQARTKAVYNGEYTFVNQSNKIWEAFDEYSEIKTIDIPFKIQLPYNLPESITTDVGSVRHILRAVVTVKGLLGKNSTHVAKLLCPLKRILTLDHTSSSPYKVCGESQSGVEYTFMLPPGKQLNIGSFVSIPMLLRFLRPDVGIERVEVSLKASMDFQCSDHNEKRHLDQQIAGLVISRSELRYMQPSMPHYNYGECTHTINLFIPPSTQPTYQGRFINITYKLSINVSLYGHARGFLIEEQVKVSNIVEKNTNPKRPYSPLSGMPSPTIADGIPDDNSLSRESLDKTPGSFAYQSYNLQMMNQLRQPRSLPELPQCIPLDDNYRDPFNISFEHKRISPFDVNNGYDRIDRVFDGYVQPLSDTSSYIYQPYSPSSQHSRSETPQTPPSSFSTTTSNTNISPMESISSNIEIPNSSITPLSLPPYYRHPSTHQRSSLNSNDYSDQNLSNK
ncbi:arrestin/py protein 2 [Gigaspora margarita]|uniref:Arrestin/py protein 2 n=1 Tax=Gigaspora margarita TaxID=4874 RepID=A0A8H4AJX0_GIGMA|nr:arrestin/py protein 2 [Gigaspora margarita]